MSKPAKSLRSKTPSRRKTPYRYCQLESKLLLAGIELLGSEVLIGGTTDNDRAVVSQTGSTITVTQTGFATQTFAASEVDSILFIGLAGDDYFENQTAIPSRAFGQVGNDTLIGGSGNDRLIGNSQNDIIRGNGGDDFLVAGIGDDIVDGGDGADRVLGINGTNTITGGNGDDLLFGGNGIDRIAGNAGDDVMAGNDGNDTLIGGEGDDSGFGGADDDVLEMGAGADFGFGQSGADTISGGTGNDRLGGGDGDDVLQGDAGSDRMAGNAGNDRVGVDGSRRDFQVKAFGGRLEMVDFRDDTLGDKDATFSFEEAGFSDGVQDRNVAQNVPWEITVQPVVAANTDGSNRSEFMGNAEQEAEIKVLVDRIFAQAGVDVTWLRERRTNNSFFNVGGATRPAEDLQTIIDRGDSSGLGSSDPNVIDMYFVERHPASPTQSENVATGLSAVGTSGVAIQVGDNLVDFFGGREAIARVIAHEMAHNLGLEHTTSTTNLLRVPVVGDRLTAGQISAIRSSSFTRRV